MKRKIIAIDRELCNGCGLCAAACREGAIGMAEGKAQLLRDDYCDGLGSCLPVCPAGALTFVEREAAAYNEEEVQKHLRNRQGVCPGANAHAIRRTGQAAEHGAQSELGQWPVQIRLVPVNAPYFEGAKLLIAADCAAYARANFHSGFIRGRIALIGCPKLDDTDYSEKLGEIITNNSIRSVTVVRMEVPCCGGIEHAAVAALKGSGKFIPWQVVTIRINGEIQEE
jgi:NAD-dependent dihydropyrimidine dehydrogenase PreA subunit